MGNIPIYSAEKRPSRTKLHHAGAIAALAGGIAITGLFASPDHAQAQTKRPNIVMLMPDDTGWGDFGAYSGGARRSVIQPPTCSEPIGHSLVQTINIAAVLAASSRGAT